jgi:clan AA aspartic protease
VGLTYVTVRLGPLAGSKKKLEESFLVDTGAIDCLVSAAKLRKIGIAVEGKDVYELADGTTVELPYGFARVTFMGSETVTKVTFSPHDTESILGVTALESTGIGVDPVTRSLKRMAAKPLK